jgi:hypothetical protein
MSVRSLARTRGATRARLVAVQNESYYYFFMGLARETGHTVMLTELLSIEAR